MTAGMSDCTGVSEAVVGPGGHAMTAGMSDCTGVSEAVVGPGGHAMTAQPMSEDNLIGDFLRARRALVSPEQVGVQTRGARRVAGLRREEVAMLAGISSDYYLRLE